MATDQLNVIRSHANGRLLASGSADGKTCILSVGDALAEALPQEKVLLLQVMLLHKVMPMNTMLAIIRLEYKVTQHCCKAREEWQ